TALSRLPGEFPGAIRPRGGHRGVRAADSVYANGYFSPWRPCRDSGRTAALGPSRIVLHQEDAGPVWSACADPNTTKGTMPFRGRAELRHVVWIRTTPDRLRGLSRSRHITGAHPKAKPCQSRERGDHKNEEIA